MDQQHDTLIVTPTLGLRTSLKRTVASVKHIGKGRVKHILVAPSKHCFSLRKQFPELEVLEEPSSCKSIYEALNFAFGLYANSYKYCGFINDDDYWLDGFESLFKILDADISVDVVYAKTLYVDKDNKIIGEQSCSSHYHAFYSLLSSGITLFTQQATLSRSKWYADVPLFDTNYALVADTKFWWQIIKKGAKLKYINRVCAAYMVQEGQLSSNTQLQLKEIKQLLAEDRNKIKFIILFHKIIFKIINTPLYIKRYFYLGKMSSPFK